MLASMRCASLLSKPLNQPNPVAKMPDTTPQDDDERLVAYLDGELDDAAAVQVEQLLASNPEVRHQVEKLSRTWDLLDLLPSPRASQEFTNRTLTAVRTKAPTSDSDAVDEEVSTRINVVSAPRPSSDKWRRSGVRILAFFGLLFVAAAGFHSTYDFGARHQEELLRNYPVIRRLDEYREIRDPQFLKELHERKTFGRKGQNDERQDRKAD